MLASEDWVSLDDASRVLAIACMLIASRNEGVIPDNPAYIKRVAYLNKPPNFKPLIECGFLESDSECKQMLADARPEERRDREETEAQAGFETLWATYPPRAGGNPKDKALRAYRARVGEGHKPEEILEGARRYASFVKATGKEGTEYVKQAATFLGPDKHFLEQWTLPEQANVSPLYRREGVM